ncbi:hypothetical protein MPDQ_003098 [Monascus purpureus]|uniref:Uncharacterized protein n=1 Tax=Monascus purpureus TaxID=5098 RepID=A0A507R477_MONPU|nr:hypothetical protein MPDQ_003098 [Monascus purpureus]
MASEKKEKLEGGFTANLKLVFVASANHASRSAQIKAVDMTEEMQQEAIEVGASFRSGPSNDRRLRLIS